MEEFTTLDVFREEIESRTLKGIRYHRLCAWVKGEVEKLEVYLVQLLT